MRIQRPVVAAVFAVGLLGALLLQPRAAFAQSKETLGISSVAPTPSLKAAMAAKKLSLGRVVEAFDSQLNARISATRKFEIVSRSDLKDVLKEQELGQSGNVDAKSAAQSGKLAGAKYVLSTTLDDFEDSTETMKFPSLNKIGIKRKVRVAGVAKIYDSTTGALKESYAFRADRKDDRSDDATLEKNAELTDALLAEAVSEVATKIATRVADVVFPVRVLAKTEKQLTINRGEGGGLALGQVWDVYALGEELLDPDTKESLGRQEVKIGKAKISMINPKFSLADILEDTGIDKGAVLRLPQQTKN